MLPEIDCENPWDMQRAFITEDTQAKQLENLMEY